MSLFDLHVHSHYSADAVTSPVDLVQQAKKNGLAGFAITDHNRTDSFSAFKQLQKNEKNLLIVFAEEVKILENQTVMGEVLCYFVNDRIKPASFGEILDQARQQGALTSIAHPFDWFRKPFRKDLQTECKKVDAIEACNGRSYLHSFNRRAFDFVQKNGAAFTAGSDAHSLAELGNAAFTCSADSHEELRQAILKKKGTVFFNRTTTWPGQWMVSLQSRLGLKQNVQLDHPRTNK